MNIILFVIILGIIGKKYSSNIERIRKNTLKRRIKLFSSGIGRQKSKMFSSVADEHYGLAEPLQDIINDEELTKKKQIFLDNLFKVDRNELEYKTRQQNRCQEWFAERKKRLTASKFGDICKMRRNTSCKIRVHNMLYKLPITCKELNYGIEFEPLARIQFQELYRMNVKLCGLFLDKTYPYLAASPGIMHFILI